jgi:hypothetical protein
MEDNQELDDTGEDNQETDIAEEETTLLGGNATDDSVDSENDDAPAEEVAAYEDFTIPDKMELDEGLVGSATEKFRALDLTQEQAQGAVDIYSEQLKHFAEQHTNQISEWQSESRSDSEYGGTAFNANIGIAGKAIDQFGDDDLKGMLNETGLGNHTALIRFAWKIGQSLSEDNVGMGNATQEELSPEEILYGHS